MGLRAVAGVEPRLWGSTSLLRLPELANFTSLTLESRTWPWQEHAIPHPTSFHPSSLGHLRAWLARARRSRRATLMLFAGGASRPSRPNIRGSILSECANRTDACVVVDCSGGRCAHDPVRYMRPMLRAVQVLPAAAGGDADAALHVRRHPRRLRARVLRGPAARRQYGWHLPPVRYGEFSVHMPKEAAVFGGVRIVETLEAVPEEEVRRMRQRALEMAPRVVYRRHGSTPELRQAVNDAVDLAVDGVLQRIRRRTHALEEGLPERLYAQEEDSVSVDI